MPYPFTVPTLSPGGFGAQIDANYEDGGKLAAEVAAYTMGFQSVAYAATVTPDLSLGNYLKIGALTGAITVANPLQAAPPAGFRFTVQYIQDGTGTRVITYGSLYKATGVTIVTTASTRTVDTFVFDGTNWILQSRVTGQTA